MADPTSNSGGSGPPGVPSLFNFSDPNTTALLGALQGLGAASAPSRLPVTGGMVFGSLAGGLLSGAKQGAEMRALDTQQIGRAAQTQAGLNSLGFQQALYGQKPSSASDLLNNRYQTLQMDMPNPGGMQSGPAGAPGSLAPAMPVQSSPLPAPAGTDVGSKIVNAESGGNPTAKNPLSSALGDGQFTDATWLDLIKKQRPDLAMGRSDAQLLALRADGPLSTEMTQRYAQQNGQILIGAGQQPTPGNLYLSHFLGPAGALNTLRADPAALMASLVSDKAIKANPVLQGKTAGQMIDWANQKMAGAPTPGPQFGSLAPQGAAQQQPSTATASPGGIPNLLANPQARQLLMMNSAFPGALPPAAMEYALAQALPPGPMRDLSIAAAQQKAGMPPVQTVRQGGGIMQLGPDGQYHLGAQLPQLSKDQQLVNGPNGLQTQLIPGALRDVRQLRTAEARGSGVTEPQPFIDPVTGAPFVTSRTNAFAPGAPPLQTGLSPFNAAVQKGFGTPHALGPEDTLVIPGLMAAAAAGRPNLVPGGALPGAGSGIPAGSASTNTAATPALAPGVLRQGLNPGQEKALEVRADEEQKQRQIVIDQATAAQGQQAALQNMKAEMGNFVQGPFSEHAQTAASYLRLIDPSYNGQVASYEDFVKNAGSLLRQAVHDVSSRAAVQEYNLIGQTLPNPDMSPIGLQRVANEMMGLNDYKVAKAQAQQLWEQQHGGPGNVEGFETTFQSQLTPYAFIVARMSQADRQAMVAKLAASKEGQLQLKKLSGQLQYLKASGLDSAIQ